MTSCYESISCPRNSLARSPTLSQGLRRQEAKSRMYYLRDDHSDDIFSQIKLSSRTASYYMYISVQCCPEICMVPSEASVCASSSYLGWCSQGRPSSSAKHATTGDPAPYLSRSSRFRCPPVTDGQTDRHTDGQL